MIWGSIVLVALDPAVGSEANKTRPALIVTNDEAVRWAQHLRRGVVTVAPITSNITNVRPFQVLIDAGAADDCGLRVPSKIQVEQIRSVDVKRLQSELGVLPVRLHGPIKEAITLHLDLQP